MITVPEIVRLDVEFERSLPGLSPLTSFRLEPIEGAGGLFALRSTEQPTRLFLLGISAVGVDAPPLPLDLLAEVGATAADQVGVFVVANPADDGVYVNLRAPILIHARTGAARQVIFDDPALPVRARLGAGPADVA